MPDSKRCSWCKAVKPLASFSRRAASVDGLNASCKVCITLRDGEKNRLCKQRRRREAGSRPRRKITPKTHCKHGHEFTPVNTHVRPNGKRECRACARRRALARARAQGVMPRQIAGRMPCGHDRSLMRYSKGKAKGCGECHREKERQRPYNPDRARQYVAENREAIRAYRKAWRAANRPYSAEFKAGGAPSIEYAKLIIGDPCVYCGDRATAIDHIIAATKGGTGDWENLAPVCLRCNSEKHTRDVLHFMLRRVQRQAVAAA